MKRSTSLAISFGILMIMIVGIVTISGFLLAAPAGIPAEGRLFEVRKGETSSVLASRLENEGIIRSAFAFSLAARLEGKAGQLRAGTYRLVSGMGTLALIDLVVSGHEALQRVTIPEGLTVREIGKILEGDGIVSSTDFDSAARDPAFVASLGLPGDSVEGFLFPDTYFMPKGYGAQAAIKELVSTFKTRMADIPEAQGLAPTALRDKLILASIVQKEYRVPEEAPLIASVFENRLKIGMGLQSCATVVYVLTERMGKPHPDVVYDKDLKLKDPFNTYLYRGLPPAPIANPGLVALKAVFEPAKTGYLYFRLVDPVIGTHHFSATFDEHLHAAQLVLSRTGG